MNCEEFEIFEKWRKEKYEIDLEKLRENLAGRGLSSSGIRGKEEAWLKRKFEAEIARKKAEMEEYERTEKEESSARKNMIKTNRVLVSVAIISMIISGLGVGTGIYFVFQGNEEVCEDDKVYQ